MLNILLILLILILLQYNKYLNEYFDDIYNFKVSDEFKSMFEQPTTWLGYKDFDGVENTYKLYINDFYNKLFKEKNI
jgi:hypothetical protein